MSPLPGLDYRHIVEHQTTAVLLLNPDLSVYYLNPACESLLEVSLLRIAGQPIQHLFSLVEAPLQLDEILLRVLATAQPYTHREALIRIGLKERFVDYTVTLLDRYQGDQPLLFLEVQSIDRLLRIARAEVQEQQHHAARQLIRGVAHEIKNPLGGIRGAAQLLARQLKDQHIDDYTNIMISEVDRLRHLADSLLGSPQLPHYSALNVHEPLEHVLSLIASQHPQVELVRDYDLSLPDVWADRNQLIQVFLNICVNAMQALTEQPQFFAGHGAPAPCLRVRSRIRRSVHLNGTYHRSVVCVEIEDNGPGIPPDIFESVFYPLVTGRAKGTGLGLSIVQTILRQHQGTIDCESEPGRTVFCICLPWTPPATATASSSSTPAKMEYKS